MFSVFMDSFQYKIRIGSQLGSDFGSEQKPDPQKPPDIRPNPDLVQ